MNPTDFVRTHTLPAPVPLLPHLRLLMATEVTPLWHATSELFKQHTMDVPYWAFAWPGGQALARYIWDNPHLVKGKRVVDFAAGSGLAAIIAAQAGAAVVEAIDIDPLAIAAIELNAELNGVAVAVRCAQVIDDPLADFDVVLAGDIFYDRAMAEPCLPWFRRLVMRGAQVFVGDPGRNYSPPSGLSVCATYDVPTSLDLEDAQVKRTRILQVGTV
jgi:predicted nicotinamide N-methyase